jgi:membrane associated rhomboid family serine protease
MFPIRDSVPQERTPVIVYGLILVNLLVFLYQQYGLSVRDANILAIVYGMAPDRFFYPDGTLASFPLPYYLPFVTAAFLHGGWLHIIFNMWTLFIFGSTLEGRLGNVQFLIFYLCCAVLSTYAHGYFNADSDVPVIGASGAIAGVIAAYALRFPTARITLLLPIVIIPFIFTIPALAYAAIWFGFQLLQGTWEALAPSMGGSIAWWAHIGGFIAGLALLPFFLIFAPPERRARSGWQPGPWD